MKKEMYVVLGKTGLPEMIYEDIEMAKSKSSVFYVVPVNSDKISKAYDMTERVGDVTKRVKSIICKQLNIKDVKLNDDIFNDLNMDSLDEVEVLMLLEKEFDVNISTSDLHSLKINTVKDIVEGIIIKLNKKC